MIRPLLCYPNPVLRMKALPVEVFDEKLEALVADLFETMQANKGLGLCATQVGELRRVSVMWLSKAPLVLVNPEIIARDKPAKLIEGCLSLPGAAAYVRRFGWIKVRAQTPKGETIEVESVGTDAQAIQHEIDHMNGKLYIDRLKPGARQTVVNRARQHQPAVQ